MRNYLLAAVGLLPLAAHAQAGVRAGVHTTNWSSIVSTNSRYASTTQHLSYQVGVFYQLPLVGHLSLVPELDYSFDNFELSVSSYGYASYSSVSQLKLSCLTLPLMERVTFGPVYAEVGPQLNLLVGGQERGREFTFPQGQIRVQDIDQPAAERYHRLDVGVGAGLGVQLRNGLGFGLRYYQGLRSLTREYDTGQGYDGEIRSKAVQASLSYRWKKAF